MFILQQSVVNHFKNTVKYRLFKFLSPRTTTTNLFSSIQIEICNLSIRQNCVLPLAVAPLSSQFVLKKSFKPVKCRFPNRHSGSHGMTAELFKDFRIHCSYIGQYIAKIQSPDRTSGTLEKTIISLCEYHRWHTREILDTCCNESDNARMPFWIVKAYSRSFVNNG